MKRLPAVAARAACALLLTTALSGASAAQAASVRIDNFTFTPAELVIAPGESVTWTNADDIPHTVVAADRAFKSKPLDSNDQYSQTFTKTGTYGYFCSLHPHMTGKIVVKAR